MLSILYWCSKIVLVFIYDVWVCIFLWVVVIFGGEFWMVDWYDLLDILFKLWKGLLISFFVFLYSLIGVGCGVVVGLGLIIGGGCLIGFFVVDGFDWSMEYLVSERVNRYRGNVCIEIF